MSTPAIDNSIRTAKADLLQVGMSSTSASKKDEESFDSHLIRSERAARPIEKPARKSRREQPADETSSRPSPAPPPIADVKAPPQNTDEDQATENEAIASDSDVQGAVEGEPSVALDQSAASAGLTEAGVPSTVVDTVAIAAEQMGDLIQAGEQTFEITVTAATTNVSIVDSELVSPAIDVDTPDQQIPFEIKIGEPALSDVPVEDVPLVDPAIAEAEQPSALANAEITVKPLSAIPARRHARDHSDEPNQPLDQVQEKSITDIAANLDASLAASVAHSTESNTTQDGLKDREADGGSQGSSAVSAPQHGDVAGVSSPARLPPHILTRGSERAAKEARVNEADSSRLLDRVARAVKTAENREGVVRLRLHPPELGSVRIELRMQQGVMTARLEAETATARTLLVDNVQALRDRLNEQGVRVESFDVDIMDRRSPDNPGSQEQRHARDDARHDATREPKSDAVRVSDRDVAMPIPQGTTGKLNVIV